MKARNFKLDDSDIELLKHTADALGVSQVEVVRRGIRGVAAGSFEGSPGATRGNTDFCEYLKQQIAEKDRQIERLQILMLEKIPKALPESGGEAKKGRKKKRK